MSTIELGGRQFVPVKNSTLEHDIWTAARLRAAGLERMEMSAEESPEGFAERIIYQALQSPAVFELLGGLLLPEDIPAADWTPTVALDTAAFLRSLTGADDKAALRAHLVDWVVFFILNGISSLWTIQNSLASAADGQIASVGV